MELVAKVLAGLAGTTGVSCAVAVPVTLANKGIYTSESDKHLTKVSMDICNSSSPSLESSKISFGENSLGSICWTSEGISSEITEVSQFFSSAGKNNSLGSKSSLGQQVYCRQKRDYDSGSHDGEDNSKQGTLGENYGKECDGTEYLGLKDNSESIFIKNERVSTESDYGIGLCAANCGKNTGFQVKQTQQLVEEQEENGKKVEFYKK